MPIMLVGNKCDKVNSREVSRGECACVAISCSGLTRCAKQMRVKHLLRGWAASLSKAAQRHALTWKRHTTQS